MKHTEWIPLKLKIKPYMLSMKKEILQDQIQQLFKILS